MARWLGLAIDPTAGGSTLDALSAGGTVDIPDPTVWIPGTTAQVDDGYSNTERNDEARGVRGAAAPQAFRAKPMLTFTTRLYHPVAKLLLPAVLGAQPTAPTGTAPAPVVSSFSPIVSGDLPCFFAWLVREGQTDRMAGVQVESVTLNVTEADPTLEVSCRVLYHEPIATPGTLPAFSYAGMDDPYAGVTFKAKLGASGSEVPIQCVGNFTLTFSNNHEDDDEVLYCRGENVLAVAVNGRYRRRQWPGRHSPGEQSTSGTITFGTTRQDMEDRKLFATATRLVAELAQNPLGTTPPADRTLRIVLPQWVVTGGQPDELAREGAIKSSYEWGGYIDPATSKDISIEFVDNAAVELPLD